jgi:UDP-GlcNAc3NAcA epimerase
MLKIATIVGARPQFIKAAVVSRALDEYNKFSSSDSLRLNEVVIHTGQHYDWNMSDVFFEEMQIPKPTFLLNIKNLAHGAMTGQMLEKIETVLVEEKPDLVLVYGDTNTTLAGALSAVKLNIPVTHVEAGLRSFNRLMPEEINRVLTDQISNILFCPTDQAVTNLRREGIGKNRFADQKNFVLGDRENHRTVGLRIFCSTPRIKLVGDVMLDAALFYRKCAKNPALALPKQFILATIHRAENTDDCIRLRSIFKAFEKIAREIPILLPLHPRTRKMIQKSDIKLSKSNIQMVNPVSYLNMIYLLERCRMVLTDSGGLQKEAYFFKKPCVTLRDETEWVELISHGYNFVAGTNDEDIFEAYKKISEKRVDFKQNLYGDGTAGNKIVRILSECICDYKI